MATRSSMTSVRCSTSYLADDQCSMHAQCPAPVVTLSLTVDHDYILTTQYYAEHTTSSTLTKRTNVCDPDTKARHLAALCRWQTCCIHGAQSQERCPQHCSRTLAPLSRQRTLYGQHCARSHIHVAPETRGVQARLTLYSVGQNILLWDCNSVTN